MPVMDGLEATRLIHAYELTGKWDAFEAAGVGRSDCSTDPQLHYQENSIQRKKTPIIVVSETNPFPQFIFMVILTAFIFNPSTCITNSKFCWHSLIGSSCIASAHFCFHTRSFLFAI